MEGKIEVMGRRGRRHRHLLDILKETEGSVYWKRRRYSKTRYGRKEKWWEDEEEDIGICWIFLRKRRVLYIERGGAIVRHFTEGKIEVMGRRGRRHRHILDILKETEGPVFWKRRRQIAFGGQLALEKVADHW